MGQDLPPVPNPAIETSNAKGGRDVLRQGHLHQAIAIEEPGEEVMAAAED